MDNRPAYFPPESKHFQCRYCGAIVRPGQGDVPGERPEGIDAMFCPKCIANRKLAQGDKQQSKVDAGNQGNHASDELLTSLPKELSLQRQELALIRSELSTSRKEQAKSAEAQAELVQQQITAARINGLAAIVQGRYQYAAALGGDSAGTLVQVKGAEKLLLKLLEDVAGEKVDIPPIEW